MPEYAWINMLKVLNKFLNFEYLPEYDLTESWIYLGF